MLKLSVATLKWYCNVLDDITISRFFWSNVSKSKTMYSITTITIWYWYIAHPYSFLGEIQTCSSSSTINQLRTRNQSSQMLNGTRKALQELCLNKKNLKKAKWSKSIHCPLMILESLPKLSTESKLKVGALSLPWKLLSPEIIRSLSS